MKKTGFNKAGWLYRPVNIIRTSIAMVVIIYVVFAYLAVFRNGHSVSDDLYQSFVYPSCTGFWWKWITVKTSE